MTPLWTVVNANGTITRSNGTASVTRFDRPTTGEFRGVFNRDVSRCAYTATLGAPGSVFVTNGTVQATNDNQHKDNTVWVRTQFVSGTEADLGFHLVVNG